MFPNSKSVMEKDPYENIVQVYDEAINPSLEFLGFIEECLDKDMKILDAGCGTGKFTIPLAEKGYNVMGLDSSKAMLSLAKKKAREKNLKVKFYCKKIEAMEFQEEFDAVISCDCINHFLTVKKLQKAIESIFNSLKKDGKFIFQAYTERAIEKISNEAPYGGRIGKNFFVWENFYRNRIFKIILSIFEHQKNKQYKRKEEIVLQKPYKPKKIERILKQSGFQKIQVFKQNPLETSESKKDLYFIAEK